MDDYNGNNLFDEFDNSDEDIEVSTVAPGEMPYDDGYGDGMPVEDDVETVYQKQNTSKIGAMIENNKIIQGSYKLYTLSNSARKAIFCCVAAVFLVIIVGLFVLTVL